MQQVMLTDHESGEPVFLNIDNSLQFAVGSMSGGPTKLTISTFGDEVTHTEHTVRESVAEVRRALMAAGASDKL